MIHALVRTIILVAAVLLLARFVPFVAAHEQALLIAAVAIGLVSILTRSLIVLFVLAAAALLFYFFR